MNETLKRKKRRNSSGIIAGIHARQNFFLFSLMAPIAQRFFVQKKAAVPSHFRLCNANLTRRLF